MLAIVCLREECTPNVVSVVQHTANLYVETVYAEDNEAYIAKAGAAVAPGPVRGPVWSVGQVE